MENALVTSRSEAEQLRSKLRQAKTDSEVALRANEDAQEAVAEQRFRADKLAEEVQSMQQELAQARADAPLELGMAQCLRAWQPLGLDLPDLSNGQVWLDARCAW